MTEPSQAVAVRDQAAAIVKAIPVPRELQELGVRFGADESGTRVVYLPDELRARVNLIAPVTSYVQADPNWSPGVSIVKLTKDEHTYPLPGGKLGLSKQALETLSRAAGVLYTRTARVPKDELQEGELWAYRATVGFRRSDGTVDEVTRERGFNREAEQMDIETAVKGSDRYKTDAEREAEIRKRWIAELRFGPGKTESKAINRALRAGLGVPSSVPAQALSKPWLVIGYNFTPDYSDPEIKRALVAIGLNANAAIYGGREASGDLPQHGAADIPAIAASTSTEETPPADEPEPAQERGEGDAEQAAAPEAPQTPPPAGGSSEEEPSLEDEPAPRQPAALQIPAAAVDAAAQTIAKGEKTVGELLETAAGGDAKAKTWLAWALRNLETTEDDQRRASIELVASQRHPELLAELLEPADA